MKNIWTMKLDLKKSVAQLVPTFTDGDTAILRMEVYDNGVAVDLADEGIDRGILNIKVSDGSIVGGMVTITGNTVEYTFGDEAQNEGTVECKLMLYDDDNNERVSTMPFNVVFDDNWVATDPSNPTQDIATVLIARVDALEERIDEIEAGAGNAHSHDNFDVLNKLEYTGELEEIDLIGIEQNAAAIVEKADIEHTHAIPEVTGLQSELNRIDPIETFVGNVKAASQEPTGFPTLTTSQIGFVDATRTFSISPKAPAPSFDIYQAGVKYSFNAAQSIQLPNTTGLHHIYFDAGVLYSTLTFSSDILRKYVYVANVYYNVNQVKHILLGEERHGSTMDGETHAYLHETVGSAYINGMALGSFTLNGDGSAVINNQFAVSTGRFRDEDIQHNLSEVLITTGLPVFYRVGADGWQMETNAGYAVLNTGSGRLAYNQFTGGTWQKSEVAELGHVLCHVFASNDTTHPYVAIMGQNTYPFISDARTGSQSEINNLVRDGLPFAEFIPIGTVIFQSSSGYTSPTKSRIRDIGSNPVAAYVDWRTQKVTPSLGSNTSHANLTDRSAANAHPATAISIAPAGNIAATTVQAAIEELDAEKAPTVHSHDGQYANKVATEAHIADMDNPHGVTKEQVGLGNVNNTSDLNKPVSNATQSALNGKAATVHQHAIADVTNLESQLADKAASVHNHTKAQIIDLTTDLATINSALSGKAASVHTHAIADVAGLQTQVDNIASLLAALPNIFQGDNSRGSKYITSGDNVDNILKSGFYYSTDSTHHPIAHNGFIWHNQFPQDDGYAMQMFQAFNFDHLYTRRKLDGVWQAWTLISYTNPVKYLSQVHVAISSGASSINLTISYDTTKDSIHVYLRGLKLIKGRHYTATNTVLTFLNSFTLTTNDDVLIEVYKNTL